MKFTHIRVNRKVLLPLGVLFVLLTLAFPRSSKFAYDYKTGSAWNHETLLAQFDFPILKTEEQLREERAQSKNVIVPYYKYRQDVVDNSVKAAQDLKLGSYSSLRPAIVSALNSIYSNGVVSDEGIKLDKSQDDPAGAVIYIQKDKRASKKPADEVYKESAARARLLSILTEKRPEVNVDSILRSSGAYDLIVPNLDYDARTTELVNTEASSGISTTQGFVRAGQLIVSEGEIVTSEVEQILDSYKVEYENNMGYGGPKFHFWAGNAVIAFVLVLLFFLIIYFLNDRLFLDTGRFWYLIFLFVLFTYVTLFLAKHSPRALYIFPMTLAGLYLEAFFKNKIIFPLCCLYFLPMLIFADNGVVHFVISLVSSLAAVFVFKYFSTGWMQFVTAGIAFAAQLVTYFGFRLVDLVNDDPYQTILYMFISCLLIVAGYPLIYIFERMFNLLSASRLRELCDTNNTLLRDLETKAPGTFQHSLQVMNMTETAARAIDANIELVRAGALYHDIGKMMNPLCFVENDSISHTGAGYHDKLSPKQSAIDIIRHVQDGMDLAAKNHLPAMLKEFIVTHHGTSAATYFYNKYLNDGGDPADVQDFFYKGHKPRTKEQVILMICDSLEAASRTLKEHTPEAYSAFVEKIVKSKIDAGQFDEAEISIRDISAVKEAMKTYLAQMQHERVEYIERKTKQK